MTIREILDRVSDCIDFDESHYYASSIMLSLANGREGNFCTHHDKDKRHEMYIGLGNGLSTFKHGHIKTVYCIIPREAVTPEIEKYRDTRDPHTYKFWLPERVFNSILKQFPIDINKTVDIARNHYALCGYEWDGEKVWREKVLEWFN